MMSFYTGRDAALYEQKFKKLQKYFVEVDHVEDSRAAVFRHMVDKVYAAIIKNGTEGSE
jgi:hypothetical protein